MNKLIVAVSGGVDSMVLLDILVERYGPRQLVVAHVNHGIRDDSSSDESLVRQAAEQYEVENYEVTHLNLPFETSEDDARQRRYAWLRSIAQNYQSAVIVTAHHQDDVIETIYMQIQRGTRWRGLSSLRSKPDLLRPLLRISKAEIIEYALTHGIKWREDSTNFDIRFTRNYVRHCVVPRINAVDRKRLVGLWESQVKLHQEIDNQSAKLLHKWNGPNGLSRYSFVMNDRAVRHEILQQWIGQSLQIETLERLEAFICTGKKGSRADIEAGKSLVSHGAYFVVKDHAI